MSSWQVPVFRAALAGHPGGGATIGPGRPRTSVFDGTLLIGNGYLAFEAVRTALGGGRALGGGGGLLPSPGGRQYGELPEPVIHLGREVEVRCPTILVPRLRLVLRGDPDADEPGPVRVPLRLRDQDAVLARLARYGFRTFAL